MAAARELGRVLVPALCRRLRAATGALARLDARLARDARAALGDERAARREEALADELRRVGYCLGVLGAGARADLLRGRHERAGLRWMAQELADAHGLALAPAATHLPELTPTGERGWNLVLLAGVAFHAAAVESTTLEWRVERDELLVALPERPSAELQRRCRRLSSDSGLRLRARARALGLALS